MFDGLNEAQSMMTSNTMVEVKRWEWWRKMYVRLRDGQVRGFDYTVHFKQDVQLSGCEANRVCSNVKSSSVKKSLITASCKSSTHKAFYRGLLRLMKGDGEGL